MNLPKLTAEQSLGPSLRNYITSDRTNNEKASTEQIILAKLDLGNDEKGSPGWNKNNRWNLKKREVEHLILSDKGYVGEVANSSKGIVTVELGLHTSHHDSAPHFTVQVNDGIDAPKTCHLYATDRNIGLWEIVQGATTCTDAFSERFFSVDK
jgi:hypothetical protein